MRSSCDSHGEGDAKARDLLPPLVPERDERLHDGVSKGPFAKVRLQIAHASAIWAVGGVAELHVWAGGFHSFDGMAPQAAVSVAARETRTRFVARILGISDLTVGPLSVG
jgi:hypothetical protein